MTRLIDQRAFAALAATSVSVVVTDATLPDNPIVYVNEAFSDLCGYPSTEAVGRNCRFLQGPDTDLGISHEIRIALAHGQGIRREILNYRKDGTPFWNDVSIDPIHDAEGLLTGFVAIQRQADSTHFAAQEKAEAETRLARIADHMPGYIYQRVMRTDGVIEMRYCSPSLRRLLGLRERDMTAKFYDHVHPDDRDGLFAAIRSSAQAMSIFREEFRLVSASGAVHWLRSDAPPRRLPNGEIVWDGLAIEIDAEKRWESEIANLALRDPLTGLLTRTAWLKAVAVEMARADGDGRACGVICLDIAAFSALNDRLGQTAGDEVLRQTAQRVSKLAASVAGLVARMGGDEFAVLAPDGATPERLSKLALSLAEALAQPMDVAGRPLAIQTRIGAAVALGSGADRTDGEDAVSELMMQAELALRLAKQGAAAFVLYAPEHDDRVRNQTILAQSLEQAIANDELDLHYQPLVDLMTGAIVSAEALVRWNHPTLGMQRPDVFVPLAERLGLIVPLGAWVIKRALLQRKTWEDAGLRPPPLAINVSGSQLLDSGFVDQVRDALAQTGVSADGFELELTEGLLIEPSDQVMSALHALRDLGFSITIDDFGSGHASFRYLRDFPIDKLKIDQLFVRKLVLESTDALIIRAVISLARSMRVALVAEGVETEMQRDFLAREGCQIGQGFLFAMPLVAEDFAWMLANDVRLPLNAPQDRSDIAGAQMDTQTG